MTNLIVLSYKRLSLVTLLVAITVTLFSRCLNQQDTQNTDPRGEAFTGSAKCLTCHKDVAASWLHTAHALTSRPGDSSSVKGPVSSDQLGYSFGEHGDVHLQRRDSGLFQVAINKNKVEAHRLDITIGSGRKAQTYLYWKGEEVYELPLSYFITRGAWAISPHFPADSIWFGRPITTDCFECHSSFIRNKPARHVDAFHQVDEFDRASLLYGIDCERCHGPGAQHAAWQQAHPAQTSARYIAILSSLTRQQKLDICAACHSGVHTEQRSVFHFRPGQALADYFYAEPMRNPNLSTMDVHGNQYQLLTASKCFLKSQDLECNTCHNAHIKERDDLTAFAHRCQTCHLSIAKHPAMDSTVFVARCIDCHMPPLASQVITMQTAAQHDPIANLVRTHYIAVYPDVAKKILAAR